MAIYSEGVHALRVSVKPDSVEGRMIAEMEDALATIEAAYSDALLEAGENYMASEKTKNTAAEGGVKYAIRKIDSSSEKIEQNIVELSKMAPVYNVSEDKLKRTGKSPTEIFMDYFSSWGNNIYSDELGDIALKKSSVRSEIRHGITARKMASIEAIPEVIKRGKVIFADIKKKSDVERIVVGAPISIGTTPYYMGVMLQRDSQNQRLYLHDVAIEKEALNISQADLLTTGADEDEHLFTTTILQNALSVKYQMNESRIRYSSRDSAYRNAVESNDMATAQKLVNEAAKEAGYTNLFYHGSKRGGGFTEFRDWSYFTENRQYAERYAERGNEASVYRTFVKLDRPFDTRKNDAKSVFEEMRNEYGLGKLQENGLPDWTDGYDIADLIDENDLNYDGIILDEGGDMVDGKPVSRGLSYVVRKSAQIKSADPVTYDDEGNVIPLSERFNSNKSDIRYSSRDVSDAERITRTLERENARLKEDVKDLKELVKLQGQVTHGEMFTKTSVESMAKKLIRSYKAYGDSNNPQTFI